MNEIPTVEKDWNADWNFEKLTSIPKKDGLFSKKEAAAEKLHAG